MVTVEADVSCGWALAREARRQEVVYSLAAGDQPAAIMELYDWARALGLEIRGGWARYAAVPGGPARGSGAGAGEAGLRQRRRRRGCG